MVESLRFLRLPCQSDPDRFQRFTGNRYQVVAGRRILGHLEQSTGIIISSTKYLKWKLDSDLEKNFGLGESTFVPFSLRLSLAKRFCRHLHKNNISFAGATGKFVAYQQMQDVLRILRHLEVVHAEKVRISSKQRTVFRPVQEGDYFTFHNLHWEVIHNCQILGRLVNLKTISGHRKPRWRPCEALQAHLGLCLEEKISYPLTPIRRLTRYLLENQIVLDGISVHCKQIPGILHQMPLHPKIPNPKEYHDRTQ